jgi:hypothetical protein
MRRKSKRELREQTARLHAATILYNEEMSGYMAIVAARRESMNTRAGLLVASSAITVALVTVDSDSGWIRASLILGSIAAALGVIALWPRQSGIPHPDIARTELLTRGDTIAIREIADEKKRLANASADRLETMARIVQAGFIVLIASILFGVLHAFRIVITIGAIHG